MLAAEDDDGAVSPGSPRDRPAKSLPLFPLGPCALGKRLVLAPTCGTQRAPAGADQAAPSAEIRSICWSIARSRPAYARGTAWLRAASAPSCASIRPRPLTISETKQAMGAWAARCRRLARRLGQLGELAPFAEAGEAAPRLMLSSVFRNDPAYLRFFQLWRDMNRGIAAVFGRTFSECHWRGPSIFMSLWCFLRLVRAAADEYGPEGLDVGDLFVSDAAGGVTVAVGAVTVSVGAGWKLCFRSSTANSGWSLAVAAHSAEIMKPDVVMEQGPQQGAGRA